MTLTSILVRGLSQVLVVCDTQYDMAGKPRVVVGGVGAPANAVPPVAVVYQLKVAAAEVGDVPAPTTEADKGDATEFWHSETGVTAVGAAGVWFTNKVTFLRMLEQVAGELSACI